MSSSEDTYVLEPRHNNLICPTKILLKKKFGLEKWNVGNHLKRVLAKFQAERSHPWGVNGLSKFAIFLSFFHVFRVEKWNDGDRLKRVVAKFQAERSHPRGVNSPSKLPTFCFFSRFRRRKVKCWGSSESRFGKVWGRTEPCLRGKRPFEVSKICGTGRWWSKIAVNSR